MLLQVQIRGGLALASRDPLCTSQDEYCSHLRLFSTVNLSALFPGETSCGEDTGPEVSLCLPSELQLSTCYSDMGWGDVETVKSLLSLRSQKEEVVWAFVWELQ